jgi:hypothetical protein
MLAKWVVVLQVLGIYLLAWFIKNLQFEILTKHTLWIPSSKFWYLIFLIMHFPFFVLSKVSCPICVCVQNPF